MAKRLTDTEKWKDPFFNELSSDYKLVWIYLLDDCNHAGIWKKSIKRLNFDCSTNLTENDILKTFGSRIVPVSDDKWFIPKFVYFQYGKEFIKSKQKSILSAIEILNEFNLIKEDGKGNLTLTIPLPNPLLTLNEPIGKDYGSGNGYGFGNDYGNDNEIGYGTNSKSDNGSGNVKPIVPEEKFDAIFNN